MKIQTTSLVALAMAGSLFSSPTMAADQSSKEAKAKKLKASASVRLNKPVVSRLVQPANNSKLIAVDKLKAVKINATCGDYN